MDRWKNKVALVTGASSGIGAALSRQFVAHGGSVVLVARREARLLALAESLGSNALTQVGDVSDPATSQRAVEAAVRHFGTLDVVIANAGISMNGRFVDTKPEVFERLMAVNYFGAVHLLRAALPVLEVTSGSFTFVSSVAGKRGLPTRSGYAASKFALQGLFESVRCELAYSGVHLGMVCPGYTATDIRTVALGPDGQPRNEVGFLSGRVMQPEVAAEEILAAVAARRREIVLTGGGRLLVTLNKMAPGLADRLARWVMR
jgi:NAD(P)-dependent dehydrogenase (short-subunit alcohol dehydrogenase family)